MRSRSHRMMRLVRIPFAWLGILFGRLVLSRLSRGMLFRVCDFGSAVMYRLDGRGKRRSLANLRIMYGGEEVDVKHGSYRPNRREELIIRRSYRNMARTIGYAFWTCRKAAERAAETGSFTPEVKAFLAENRPAVTVSGHIGCWEGLSQLACLEGHSMMSVAKNVGTAGMTEMLMKARRSIGQEIVPAEGAFRTLFKGLKEGKSLGLLVDQVVKPKHGGIWVRFFGRPVPVSAAPAFFSAKCKSNILIVWSQPMHDGRYLVHLVSQYASEDARDLWKMTQRCIADLERVIRRHPSCWVLNYNTFRRHPTADELAELERREAAR